MSADRPLGDRPLGDRPLGDRAALVTGADRSIGRAVAERLARGGARVAVHYHSDGSRDGAEAAAGAIRDAGGTAVTVQGDVADPDDADRVVAETVAAFGALDLFVANAGVVLWGDAPGQGVPLADTTPDQFDRVHRVNARGTFLSLRAAARAVSDGGRVVVVSSSSTVSTPPGFAAYASSKAVGRALVAVLAKELGPRGVTVNAVVVGATDGGFLADAPAETKRRVADGTPLGRMGTPGDAAGAVYLLALPEAGWITGQSVLANGGSAL